MIYERTISDRKIATLSASLSETPSFLPKAFDHILHMYASPIMVQTEGFEPPFATPVTFKELEALLGYVWLDHKNLI